MSFAPRLVRVRKVEGARVRYSGFVGNGARSRIRRAGCESIVPRREVRRPAWSGVGGTVFVSFWVRGRRARVCLVVV